MFYSIDTCRICGNDNLIEILNLGFQSLTGVFLNPGEHADKAPLMLVKCHDDNPSRCCGLVQLKHTYQLSKMYGENYGYRSGLNTSMVRHLQENINDILAYDLSLTEDDLIIDIGSNDGTTLNNYPKIPATLIGIDPTAKYFSQYYKKHINIIPDFFSVQAINEYFPHKKAKIITSFSMYYDLEDPQAFTNQIAELLDNEGIWVFEQSYLPLMLKNNSFDTICHEHLEYYSINPILWMLKRANLKILDIKLNAINGGSFCVFAAKKSSIHKANRSVIDALIAEENAMRLSTMIPFEEFCQRIAFLKKELLDKFNQIKNQGKTIYGIGASTKGNVLLQYYGLDAQYIKAIGEVNADKFGKVTPGSQIPIDDEQIILDSNPDYLFILPWHFKDYFKSSPKHVKSKLIFPLPTVEEIA